MRSTDSADNASIARSRARTTFGVAPRSRSQSATDSRSSRSASGCDHGSSGSTVLASAPNSSESAAKLARSASSIHGKPSPT